jgi:6-phosphogluconolactonase (cycloisomerase 2 family)
MQSKNQISFPRKTLYGIMLFGIFFSAFGARNLPSARAQEGEPNTPSPEVQVGETVTPIPEVDSRVMGGTLADSGQASFNNYHFEPPFPRQKSLFDKNQPGRKDQISLQSGSDLSAQAFTLGAVGLNFSYAQTFGTTETPYIADTAHLNHPWGIATDGTNVLIGEYFGHRVLKYTNAGVHMSTIGRAGASYNDGEPWGAFDMAVDASGNTWVVDNDSGTVLKYDSSNNFLEYFHNDGTFNKPAGIAFDSSGNVYISDGGAFWNDDIGRHRVLIFNGAGDQIGQIGTTDTSGPGNNQLYGPQHLAIYGTTLYIADAGNQRVQIFNITNPAVPSYSATIGVTGQSGSDSNHFNHPAGIAVDANYIYVADRYNNRVQIFNRSTLVYFSTFGDWGTGDYQFKDPADVAVDSAGYIYVADFENSRVQQFNSVSSGLVYQRTYGETGVPYLTDSSHYNSPSDVAVASDGSMYITEDTGQRLIKLNADGTTAWIKGDAGVKFPDWPPTNYQLQNPADIAINAAGKIYVADQWNQRVQVYNPDGTYHSTIGWGTGNYQFACPVGLAIAQNGYIYVTDPWRQRVQIFNSSHVYVGTLGETDVSGPENWHFNNPQGVAVDSNGTIYVADSDNHRVQVFNSSGAYVRTLGATGSSRWGFTGFNTPSRLAVDSSNRLYVSDSGNDRIQVFDSSGAYLTSVGGDWGNRTSSLRYPHGLTIDQSGALYVADSHNHRIQKYTIGTPNWSQTNLNGFGERNNRINSLASFGNQLYAGTYNYSGNGAQLWRSSDGKDWSPVMTDGFGDATNLGIDHMIEFNGKFYAGTWNSMSTEPYTSTGGQIWRSDTGTGGWTKMVNNGFGDAKNSEIIRFAVFNNQIYASTWADGVTHGGEIWRSSTGNAGASDAGDWTKVVSNALGNGLGDVTNVATMTMETFNGYLYAGTNSWDNATNQPAGCEVWRTANGTTWEKVNTDGFGNSDCYAVSSLVTFGGSLYASTGIWDPDTQTSTGGQVWRCTAASGCDAAADWTEVTAADGFGDPANDTISSLRVLGNRLYAITSNPAGEEVWNTGDGTNWQQVGFAGFGDSNNVWSYNDNSVTIFNNSLFIGTANWANGGEIWSMALPTPVSITRSDANPTGASVVNFTVTFSKPVVNVGQNDFSLDSPVGSSISGATIGIVSGSGTTYTVPVNTGTGNGGLRLDIPVDATINDLVGNSLTGIPFTSGESYTLGFVPMTQWTGDYNYNEQQWRIELHPRMVADVNKDGCADIIGFGFDRVLVALSNCSNGFGPMTQWTTDFSYNAQGWRVDKHPRMMADVNNDGCADIVGFGYDRVLVALSNCVNGFAPMTQWTGDYNYNEQQWRIELHPRMVEDVNKDGCADIVGFGFDRVLVALSNCSNGFGPMTQWTTDFSYNAQGWRVDKHPRMMADANNDGCADIVGFGYDRVLVALSNCVNGFYPMTQWTSDYNYNEQQWRIELHPRMVADVNKDGCADIVGFGFDRVFVSLSNCSNGFGPMTPWTTDFSYNAQGWRVDMHPRMMADVNNDGRADIIGFGYDRVLVATAK